MKKPSIYLCLLTITLLLTSSRLFAQVDYQKTQILVLGTQHLSQIKDFNPKMLDKVVARLDNMQFDAVCVEGMPGELLYDIQSRKDNAYADLLKRYGGYRLTMADSVQKKLNISFLDAQKKASELLQKEHLSKAERKQLMYYFIASTDIASATLQYKYLMDDKNMFKSEFDRFLVKQLEKNLNSNNKTYSLGMQVASNQKLERIGNIDNLQDESYLLKHFPTFIEDYTKNKERFADIINKPVFRRTDELIKSGVESNDLSDLYFFLNSKQFKEQDFDAQWKVWFTTNFPGGSDRARYSLWEMRNLQIAANILQTAAFYPRKRILIIIGASHTSFIEKYLNQVSDIELLEFK